MHHISCLRGRCRKSVVWRAVRHRADHGSTRRVARKRQDRARQGKTNDIGKASQCKARQGKLSHRPRDRLRDRPWRGAFAAPPDMSQERRDDQNRSPRPILRAQGVALQLVPQRVLLLQNPNPPPESSTRRSPGGRWKSGSPTRRRTAPPRRRRRPGSQQSWVPRMQRLRAFPPAHKNERYAMLN